MSYEEKVAEFQKALDDGYDEWRRHEAVRGAAQEMLMNLKAVEVALNAVPASGLLKHSNAILVPLLGSVRDVIAKAEGKS